MSQIRKNVSNFEAINCEKYMNRLLRQEKQIAQKKNPTSAKVSDRQGVIPRQFVINGSPPPKTRPTIRLQSPVKKPLQTTTTTNVAPSPVQNLDQNQISSGDTGDKLKRRQRSSSSSISDKEPWGKLLLTTRSREKMSSFESFDPLRTIHFLTKELQYRLQSTLPDNDDIHLIISDIHLALKRIPPEISSVIHLSQEISPFSRGSPATLAYEKEKLILMKTSKDDKICQTPPTLNQDDTAKLKKIMEESTEKLEKSCKQLESLCVNLQNENEALVSQLKDEKTKTKLLNQRIRDLESEIDHLTTNRIRVLEKENGNLQLELARSGSNSNCTQLKKWVAELEAQKKECDVKCAKLQYDLTLLSMEKEKFVTMLAIRDKEVKDVHEEMKRVQDEVCKQLAKLNSANLSKTSSTRSLNVDCELITFNDKESVDDATISSIATDSPTKKDRNVYLELHSGDGSTFQDLNNKSNHKIVEFQGEEAAVGRNDDDAEFEVWLGEMTAPLNVNRL